MHWSQQTLSSNTREDSTHGHHQMVNTEMRLIIFFAVRDGEAKTSQEKKGWVLTGSDHELLMENSGLNGRKYGKPLDHSGTT